MPVQYTLFIVGVILSAALCHLNKKMTGLFYGLLLLALVLIVGLRSEYVGADSVQYYLTFKELNQLSLEKALNERYAAGYVFFARLVGLFFSSPYFFFFIVALITLFVYFNFLKRYSKNIFFSILLFFCFTWTDFIVLMRQGCALTLVLCGIPFLIKEKFIPYILFVVLAAQFHSSALFASLLLPLVKIHFNRKTVLLFLLGSIILASSISVVWNVVGAFGIGSYINYAGGMFDTTGTSLVNDFAVKVLPSLLCLFVGLKNENDATTKEENFFFMACLMNIAVAIIGMSSLILGRLNMYTSFSIPVVATYVFSSTRYSFSSKKLCVFLCASFAIVMFSTIQIARPYWMKITPYSAFWNPIDAYGYSASRYFW